MYFTESAKDSERLRTIRTLLSGEIGFLLSYSFANRSRSKDGAQKSVFRVGFLTSSKHASYLKIARS